MITRRSFLYTFGLTAVAGLSLNAMGQTVGVVSQGDDFFLVPGESMSDLVYSFTGNHFKPFVGMDFQIRQEGMTRRNSLRLLEVKEHESKANARRGVRGESFSLLFQNLRGTQLDGVRTEFNHELLGGFQLLITAVGPEPNYYEAVINHLQR